jgi:hypothetical protein
LNGQSIWLARIVALNSSTVNPQKYIYQPQKPVDIWGWLAVIEGFVFGYRGFRFTDKNGQFFSLSEKFASQSLVSSRPVQFDPVN